jgi:hypothetical protein
MAYTPDYTQDDLTSSVIDGIVTFVIVLAGFASLIALVFLYKWGKNKVM